MDEKDKLDRKEEKAKEELRALTNKLDRLRKQRKRFRRRGIEMLRRGIKGAEAMEKFERLKGERKKKEVELASVLASFSGQPELGPPNNLN